MNTGELAALDLDDDLAAGGALRTDIDRRMQPTTVPTLDLAQLVDDRLARELGPTRSATSTKSFAADQEYMPRLVGRSPGATCWRNCA